MMNLSYGSYVLVKLRILARLVHHGGRNVVSIHRRLVLFQPDKHRLRFCRNRLNIAGFFRDGCVGQLRR